MMRLSGVICGFTRSDNTAFLNCVEVAPAYDHAELTSNAAATLVWTYLCGQVAKRPR